MKVMVCFVLQVNAVVTMANGLRFQGSQVRNQEQASESAASAALINMVSAQHQMFTIACRNLLSQQGSNR